MEALQRLLAIEEIKALKARYFRCLDTKDWDGLARVFAPDAIFDLRHANVAPGPSADEWPPPADDDPAVFRGQAAVLERIQRGVEHRITIHHGHMPEIELADADRANGIWAMEDKVESLPGAPPYRHHGFGHYHDTYVRLPTGWSIRTTRITRLLLARE